MSDQKFDYDRVHNAARAAQQALWAMGAETREITTFNGLTTLDTGRLHGPKPRPICPDCGEPISLQPSGWWTHDGLPHGCWRLSLDGPNVEED